MGPAVLGLEEVIPYAGTANPQAKDRIDRFAGRPFGQSTDAGALFLFVR
jgi:hypothetical protein